MTPEEIEAVMSAIADLVPLEDGSLWSPLHSPSWPGDYSTSERRLRRAIARAPIEALDRVRGE